MISKRKAYIYISYFLGRHMAISFLPVKILKGSPSKSIFVLQSKLLKQSPSKNFFVRKVPLAHKSH